MSTELYDISYFGNDGLFHEYEEVELRPRDLPAYVTSLEERGVWGVAIYDCMGGDVYSNGGFERGALGEDKRPTYPEWEES